MVFEWNYDDPEDHLRYEAHTYGSALRKPTSWLRAITGQINYRRLIRSFGKLVSERIRRGLIYLKTTLTGKKSLNLGTDMMAIKTAERQLTLILSENDPGLMIMRLQAKRETNAAIRSGELQVLSIENGNHGLSKKYMQDNLFDLFAKNCV